MANQIMNFARGKVGYYANDSLGLSGSNSRIVLVVLMVAEADNTLNNYDDLGTLLAASGNTEANSTGYSRKEIAAAGVTFSVNDSINEAWSEVDTDQTWTAVSQAASEVWVKLLVCYDADNTTGTDSNIIVLTHHDFSVTPNGGPITADFDQTDGFWMSQ